VGNQAPKITKNPRNKIMGQPLAKGKKYKKVGKNILPSKKQEKIIRTEECTANVYK